ncbi:MAG: response regulator [Rhodopseudomonas sp.]|nr:response regulator [Rhodopseudomonas sp.]
MEPGHKSTKVTKPNSRNTRALVLFGRSAMATLAVASGGLGFIAGIQASSTSYNPHAYATGAGTLFAATCAVIAFLLARRRKDKAERRKLEMRLEELADRNWELREAEERARSLLEAQGDLIVRRDTQGRVTYANNVYCALAGASRETLLGQPATLPVLEQGAIEILADGTRVHDQKIAAGDKTRWIAWREVAVRGEDGSEVQSVGRDVTGRVEAERGFANARDAAQAANDAKSRFLAMVSHEIRTPLNGLLGMADLLLDTPLTPEQLTYAKAAKTSGETLLSLIQEVLDFSKIEAGKLDLDPQPFALVPLIEEAVELMAVRAQAKDIEIASFVDDRLPAMFIGDAARLRQVLLNLIGNAIKFTEQGGVAVIAEPDDDRDGLRLIVRDSGIGLRPEDQARIFEDFEQADGSSTRQFGGTGLGLAISKRLVERMAGSIGVDSRPGEGATFDVTLPLRAATDDGRAGFGAPDLTGQNVLIVTSAEIEASLLERRLNGWGAWARIARSEAEAGALFAERHWHTLLVDFPLARPIIDNNGLATPADQRRLVLIRPGDRHELPALKAAGFTGYLVKPIRSASLAARLTAHNAFEQALVDSVDEINRNALDATSAGDTGAKADGLAVLVAEDNEINALLIRALLDRLGHRPTVVGDGHTAVDAWQAARAKNAPFDLVLMDVQMPGLDGLEAARRIRDLEAAADGPPTRIMALTANAYSEDRAACLSAGMDGLLVKPLDRERLREVLEAAAGRATLAA